MGLTKEQELIIEHKAGHAVVSAVAGSGKSTAIVHRIKRLIDDGCSPGDILVVMFNRDAKLDFDKKIGQKIGFLEGKKVFVGTFHRVGNLLTKILTEVGKLPLGKLVTTESHHYNFVRDILEPVIKRTKGLSWAVTFTEFFRFVDIIKGDIRYTPLDVFEKYGFAGKYRFFISAFQEYENRRKSEGLRFFSDMIYDPMVALKKDMNAIPIVRNRFEYIIVDEFQDINAIQYEMIKIVAGSRAQVMVVGDADQCIYTWRGANPEYIQNIFSSDYIGAKQFFLSYTFRYGHRISMAANHVIQFNSGRAANKLCISHSSAPDTVLDICIEQFHNSQVVKILQDWFSNGNTPSSVGVLLRSFGLSLPLELALLQEGIPYKMVGGTRAFELPELSAIISALYISTNRLTELNEYSRSTIIKSFLKTPKMGLSFDEIKELTYKISQEPENGADYLYEFSNHAEKNWMRRKLEARSSLWRNLKMLNGDSALEAVNYIYEHLGMDAHIDFTAGSEEAAEDLRRLFESFTQYVNKLEGSIVEFLVHVEELMRTSEVNEEERCILITSIHRSKGREWPLVILPSLYQGALPNIPGAGKSCNMEEERRLFYVAITRAINRCVLLCPDDGELKYWLSHGNSGNPLFDEVNTNTASSFMYEGNLFLSQKSPQFLLSGAPLPEGVKCTGIYNKYKAQMEKLNENESN